VPDGPVYIYGVCSADALRAPAPGFRQVSLEFVDHGPLRALISRLDKPVAAAPATVRAHWQVLREVIAEAMVLPVRFGTVVDSELVARGLLEDHEAELTRLLDELDGVVQVAVKGEYRGQAALEHLLRESPDVAALRDRLRRSRCGGSLVQQMHLGELVVSELLRLRQADTQLALDTLEPHSESFVEEPAPGDEAAFNLAFLVRRDRDSAFGRAVAQLRGCLRDRIEIRYLGPLPPFSFVDMDLRAGAPSWA
jgi:Gas vesicle synthesis protein GvpL/GvpF